MALKNSLLASALAFSLVGCVGAPEIDGDAEGDSFGGAFVKADGRYGQCELRKVLELVNRSSTDRDTLLQILEGIRTRERATDNILAHRNGADGTLGTGDDDLFDDLEELDRVSYVGPVTLDRLVTASSGECDGSLETRPFIDSNTFAGSTGGGWTRDNVELEATYAVSGPTGARLRETLLTEDDGESVFEDIAESSDVEAFAYGYAIDEMPWDRDSHDIREAMPYVFLTIESGRFEPHPETGVRELSLGTDIMDDTYFDTQAFDLVHRGYVLRGRARWDTADTIRRLLIAAKEGSLVDEEGIKRAAKVDVRRDSPSAEQIASLITDVQRGMVRWDYAGTDTPVEPIRVIYEALQTANALPDIDGHQDVLLLDPIAHLRSVRARFHLNEVRIDAVRSLHAIGEQRIAYAVMFADQRLADGDVTGADRDVLTRLAADGRAIADRSLLVERANAALADAGLPAGFDAATLPLPSSFGRASAAQEIEQHRVIAEAISAVYHEYAELLDDADRILSRSTDRDWDDHATFFVEWMRSRDATLGRNQAIDPYMDRFEAMDPATEMAAFNAWCVARRDGGDGDYRDFVEVDAAGWALVGRSLALEMLKIHQRQIEAAGTAGRALWFDEARELYVPGSSRQTGNFIIDTTDMTDMVSHAEWERLSEDERRIDRALPAASVFHTTLVNEVQIELGSEAAYVSRIEELRALVDGGTASAEDTAALEGARFVFSQYRDALLQLAELKRDRVRSRLRRNGISDVEWGAAERSKGETALLMLADEL